MKIKHILYINLDKSVDRREQMEKMLKQYDLEGERFSAIQNDYIPALGCSQSHLAVLKLAKERGYPHIFIMEDDFEPICSPEEFHKKIQQIPEDGYDVFQLVLGKYRGDVIPDSPFIKVLESQMGAGYIVHERFYDRLIQIYEEGCSKLELTWQHWLYMNDQVWKSIQPYVKWFCFKEAIARQRAGFSTLCRQHVKYDDQELV